LFRSKKKRDKKGRRGRQTEVDSDDELQEELNLIRRPLVTDLLPFALYRLILRVVKSLPTAVQLLVESLHILIKSRFVGESSDDDNSSPAGKNFFVQSTNADVQ
jgi:hypothetical protein